MLFEEVCLTPVILAFTRGKGRLGAAGHGALPVDGTVGLNPVNPFTCSKVPPCLSKATLVDTLSTQSVVLLK